MLECQIQAECIQWFRRHYPKYIIFCVPNEAAFKRKSYFDSLGLLNGVSDTIAVLSNTILFIEFKTPKGQQREEQKVFQEKVESLGFIYTIVRSLDQFKELIYDAIGNNQTV